MVRELLEKCLDYSCGVIPSEPQTQEEVAPWRLFTVPSGISEEYTSVYPQIPLAAKRLRAHVLGQQKVRQGCVRSMSLKKPAPAKDEGAQTTKSPESGNAPAEASPSKAKASSPKADGPPTKEALVPNHILEETVTEYGATLKDKVAVNSSGERLVDVIMIHVNAKPLIGPEVELATRRVGLDAPLTLPRLLLWMNPNARDLIDYCFYLAHWNLAPSAVRFRQYIHDGLLVQWETSFVEMKVYTS